ncbi:hypothetical protein [Streptomyces sp. NPDC049881]|uniref:WXG100 family type VII secretion target n=1 Tax=Streptomyces sp. NPDC049881 TaxID=3155778 RepID=UPI003436F542
MPNYEHYSHRELAAALESADPLGLADLGKRLRRLAPELSETGASIAVQMTNVAWQGETADVFRAWGKHFHKQSRALGQYVETMGQSMEHAGQAVWEARATMPEAPPMTVVSDPLDGTPLGELNRQEAIGVMERLASNYRVAAERLQRVEEPGFELPYINLKGVVGIEPSPPTTTIPYGASGYDTSGASGASTGGVNGAGQADAGWFPQSGSRSGANSFLPPYDRGATGAIPPTYHPPLGDDRIGTSLDSVPGDSATGLLPPPQSAGERVQMPPVGRTAVPGDTFAPLPPPGQGTQGRWSGQTGRYGPQGPGGPGGPYPRDYSAGQAARNAPSSLPRTANDPVAGRSTPVGRPMGPGQGAGRYASTPPPRSGIVGGIPRPAERLTKGIPRGGALGVGTVPALRDPGTGAVRGPGGGLVGRSPVVGSTGYRADTSRDARVSGTAGKEATPGRPAVRDAGRAGGITGRGRQPKRRRRRDSRREDRTQRERDSPS